MEFPLKEKRENLSQMRREERGIKVDETFNIIRKCETSKIP